MLMENLKGKSHLQARGDSSVAGTAKTFAAALFAAILFTLVLALPVLPARAFADDGSAAEAAAQAGGAGTQALPSASTVSGADFLAALDAYVAANPAADSGDYVEIDGDTPSFTADDATTEAFQSFSQLDSLGRCGTAYACLGPETLPTDARDDISEVHPSGWVQNEYDFVDGGSLYNRSHLIAHCLSGQNANEQNLITGTRHFNADVMEPIEAMVLDYIEQTGNHVLYRVTPVFENDELVARGVQIEALSMEDGGQGVSLNVYLRNTQPGVVIDYATGDNWADGTVAAGDGDAGTAATDATAPVPDPATTTDSQATASSSDAPATATYVVNTNTGKFHYPSCPSVQKIKDKNRMDTDQTRDELIAQGYVPCKNCNP